MKKLLLLICMCCLSAMAYSQSTQRAIGDVNGDGKVDASDVACLVGMILKNNYGTVTLYDGHNVSATSSNTNYGTVTKNVPVILTASLKDLYKYNFDGWYVGETLISTANPYNFTPDKDMNVIGRFSERTTGYGVEYGHQYIDLGLSVMWATCNIGATNPQDYGDYFAWGETMPYYTEGHSQDNPCTSWISNKTGYNFSSLVYCSDSEGKQFTKYVQDSSYGRVDDIETLDLADDAAHVNWKGTWRMPTTKEQYELRLGCFWEWTTNYNNTGVKGYIVYKAKNNSDKGKIRNEYIMRNTTATYSLTDVHIFLPIAGSRINGILQYKNDLGYYWSSSLKNTSSAYCLGFFSQSSDTDSSYRCSGLNVRAVCPK